MVNTITTLHEVIMRYLIIGSCVTRDAFEFNNVLKENLAGYYARTSFATLSPINLAINGLPSSLYEATFQKISSKFQSRMIQNDFDNGVLNAVHNINYDRIVVDLIDERFHLAVVGGKLVTCSSEFNSTNIYFNGVIDTFSEEWYQLWCQGIECFFDNLNERKCLEKLIINQVYWAQKQEDGNIIDCKKFSPQIISRYNHKMQRMYKFLEKHLNKEQFIQFDEDILRADSNHHWGLAPFHYCQEYYLELSRRLLM